MVKINGETWRILLVSPYHPMLIQPNGNLAVGACDDFSKTIYICDDLDLNFTKKILCHELTHAAMFSYNIELSLEQEELLAEIISTYGHEIIHITNTLFKRIKNRK